MAEADTPQVGARARTPAGSPTLQRAPRPVYAAPTRTSTSRSPAPSGRTSTRHSRGARARPAACPRPRHRVRLGLGGPGRQPWRRADRGRPGRSGRARPGPRAGRRPAPGRLDRGLDGSTSSLARAPRRRGHGPRRVDRRPRPAGPVRLLPGVRGVAPRRVPGTPSTLTDRSRALYDGLDRPWDQAANALFAARAAISAGRRAASVEAVAEVERWLAVVDDPWLQGRGEAITGELARLQRRFDDAVVHLTSAVETSRRLGFLQTEAYQLSSLGRAQCQAGDYAAGRRHPADRDRQGRGDRGRPAGGAGPGAPGPGAACRGAIRAGPCGARGSDRHGTATPAAASRPLLGDCLLAALDAADPVPGAQDRLVAHPRRGTRAGRRARRGLRPGRPRPAGRRIRPTTAEAAELLDRG